MAESESAAASALFAAAVIPTANETIPPAFTSNLHTISNHGSFGERVYHGWFVASVLTAEFFCLLGENWFLKAHVPIFAERFSLPLSLLSVFLLVTSILPGLLPLDETWEIGALSGSFIAIVCTALTMCQVTVTFVMAENDLVMFEALRLDNLISSTALSVFWIVRQCLLSIATLPPFWVFLYGFNFRLENIGNASLLWWCYMLSTLASAHLAQASFRMAGAPPIYGVWCAIQGMFCGVVVSKGNEPPWFSWIATNTPTYHMVTSLLSLELGVGKVVGTGVAGWTFLEEQLNYWNVNLVTSVQTLAFFFVVQHVLTDVVMFCKDSFRHPSFALVLSQLDTLAFFERALRERGTRYRKVRSTAPPLAA